MLYLILITIHAKELLGVIHISRHGERTPIKKFSWDNVEREHNPLDLTNTGIVQNYILGQEFRERYIVTSELIPDYYNASLVYIRSTEFARTVSSAQAQMSGFFPNGPKLASPSNKHKAVPPFKFDGLERALASMGSEALPNSFQPVFIDMINKEQDHLLLGFSKACPKIGDYIKQAQDSPSYKQKKEKYEKDLKQSLEGILNQDHISFEEAAIIGDTLEGIFNEGHGFPEGITYEIMRELAGIRDYCNSYMFEFIEPTQLASSEMLNYIKRTFEDLMYQKTTRKLSFFFAHDTTLIALLSALNGWDSLNPAFASTLVFELYKETDYKVKITYNDEVIEMNSQASISFKDFKKFVNSYALDDVPKQCRYSLSNEMRRSEENYFYSMVS